MTSVAILDLAAIWFAISVALAAMLGGAFHRNAKHYPPVNSNASPAPVGTGDADEASTQGA